MSERDRTEAVVPNRTHASS